MTVHWNVCNVVCIAYSMVREPLSHIDFTMHRSYIPRTKTKNSTRKKLFISTRWYWIFRKQFESQDWRKYVTHQHFSVLDNAEIVLFASRAHWNETLCTQNYPGIKWNTEFHKQKMIVLLKQFIWRYLYFRSMFFVNTFFSACLFKIRFYLLFFLYSSKTNY